MLTDLKAAGLSVTTQGDHLRVGPRSALTDDLRSLIRANKPQILRELANERRRAVILTARDAAGLGDFRSALVKGRLHLCGNCIRFTFGQIDSAGMGWCDKYETDTHPFVPMLRCAGFVAKAPENAPAPEYLPDPDGLRVRRHDHR